MGREPRLSRSHGVVAKGLEVDSIMPYEKHISSSTNCDKHVPII